MLDSFPFLLFEIHFSSLIRASKIRFLPGKHEKFTLTFHIQAFHIQACMQNDCNANICLVEMFDFQVLYVTAGGSQSKVKQRIFSDIVYVGSLECFLL